MAIARGNLWRIPLLPTANKPGADVDESTATVAVSPQDILRANPPTIPEQINSVYDLKTKPELIRYYHAADGFPTRPTWIAAIRNNQYQSWPVFDARSAFKFFPDTPEMWKVHGRKIKSGLRSTKQALTDESKTPPTGKPSQADHALHVKMYNLQEDFDSKLYSD